jgi:hypothetical protein
MPKFINYIAGGKRIQTFLYLAELVLLEMAVSSSVLGP